MANVNFIVFHSFSKHCPLCNCLLVGRQFREVYISHSGNRIEATSKTRTVLVENKVMGSNSGHKHDSVAGKTGQLVESRNGDGVNMCTNVDDDGVVDGNVASSAASFNVTNEIPPEHANSIA